MPIILLSKLNTKIIGSPEHARYSFFEVMKLNCARAGIAVMVISVVFLNLVIRYYLPFILIIVGVLIIEVIKHAYEERARSNKSSLPKILGKSLPVHHSLFQIRYGMNLRLPFAVNSFHDFYCFNKRIFTNFGNI